MSRFAHNFRLALRGLAKRPGFSAVVVSCLALAIGANTAVFSLLNAVLLRDLPYREPDRIVMIWNQFLAEKELKSELSPPEYVDLRERVSAFEEVAATRAGLGNLTEASGEPELLVTIRTSPNLFTMLGIRPAAGRLFRPDEEEPGKEKVAIISYDLWQRRWARSPEVIGKNVTVDGQPFTIVGVTPEQFHFRRKGRDLWIPLLIDRAAMPPRDDRWMEVYARLKPGVSLDRARGDLVAVAGRLSGDYPDFYGKARGFNLTLVPYWEEVVGAIRPALLVLAAAVGLMLLIACANVANLLLARATAREGEIALRTALGASRRSLVAQLLTESVLLALSGGAVGVALAWLSTRLLGALNLARIPRLDEIAIDGKVLLFTLGISLLTGILFGLVPALQTSRKDMQSVLKEGSKGSGRSAGRLALRALVVAEVAIAALVLVGAGLLWSSFRNLQNARLGFESKDLFTFELRLPRAKYPEPGQWARFYTEMIDRLERLPGTRSVATINAIPLGVVERTGDVEIEGQPAGVDSARPTVNWRVSSPRFFETLGVPLLSGRDFSRLDLGDTEAVVIVDQAAAERFWPGENALGKRLRLIGQGAPENWRSVVAVVGNVRHAGPEGGNREQIYVPYTQFPQLFSYVAMRGEGDVAAFATPARKAIREQDPEQAIFRVETMAQKLANTMSWRRFYTFVLLAFATVSLVLAIVGVYSVVAYSTSQRTREIGIRMALGAHAGSVQKLVLRQGLMLTGLGLAIGLVVASLSSRGLASLLHGVEALNPVTFALAAVMLLALAAFASYVPARRATRVDPKVALQSE